MTREFKSNDLSISAKNLAKDRKNPNDILYFVDWEEITERLRVLLEIKNKNGQHVCLTDAHRIEIEEYLKLLDLVIDLDVVYMADLNKHGKQTAISQPGMRYAQAEALIKTLMEDIVLLETKLAVSECEVFKLVFARGEFDMVIFNPETSNCQIYEIKHSDEQVNQQYRHLIDEEKCEQTEFRFGPIMKKTVLYRGESMAMDNGIFYQNVEEYLKQL